MRPATVLAAASRGPWPFLLLVSLGGWMAPLAFGRWFDAPEVCGASAGLFLAGGWRIALVVNPPGLLALAWLLMLLAMMPPLLAQPMRHLWRRSLRRRRARAITAFVAGYFLVWLMVGVGLMAAAIAVRAVAGTVAVPAAALAIGIAALWQAVPAKQACLNRCHRLPPLATFGLAADLDCMRFGFVAALWCVGTCWAMMLVPLAADGLHVALMAVVAVLALAERMTPPRPALWRMPAQGMARVAGWMLVSWWPRRRCFGVTVR